MLNGVGRDIPNEICGIGVLHPYEKTTCSQRNAMNGLSIQKKNPGRKKVVASIQEAIKAAGLRDGMTISFHHHFRNGDYVVNMIMEAIAAMGIKDIVIFPSSLSDIHSPLIGHIKKGVVKRIETSGLRGALAQAVSDGEMDIPVVINSHGGRARAIASGEIQIDVAFLGVPSCDPCGNANGYSLENAEASECGSLGYAMVDAQYAKKVVLITDNLVGYPNIPFGIPESQVDYIVVVDSIGDPKGIASGATRYTSNPKDLLIAKYAADVIAASGYFNDGFSLQTGSGGASLAVTRFLREKMISRNIKAGFALGGITSQIVELHEEGLIGKLLDVQSFDLRAVQSLKNNRFHYQIDKVDEPTVFIMPGLTYALAFFVKIFGKFGGITAFRIFQALLQAASMYLVFLIGRKVFNSKAALFGCFLNSLYIAEYYTTTVILTETLFKFLLLLLIYISLYAVEEKNLLYYTIGGIVWGLGCLVRPTIAAYPGVILIMWIIKKYSLKDMVKFTIVTTLAFSIVMSPWWIRNYLVFDRFIPLTLSSGNPFLQGTYVNYDQSVDYTPYEVGKTVIETNQNEINTGLYRLRTYAGKEPLKYAYWYTIGKSWYLWNFPFYWKEIFGVSFAAAAIFHHLVLTLGIVGSIILFRKRNRNFLFLFATVLFFNLIYLPYFTMSRYSYPIMPMVCIAAGYGIYEFIKRRLEYGQTANFNS